MCYGCNIYSFYICVCVCVCVRAHTRARAHTHAHACAHMCTCSHVCYRTGMDIIVIVAGYQEQEWISSYSSWFSPPTRLYWEIELGCQA